MKKNNSLLLSMAVLLALVVGFVIGISVNYPKVDKDELSGTIGKVKNYRNTKASEADIQLKERFISDTSMAKNVGGYMNLQYVRALRLSGAIKHALNEINSDATFKSGNLHVISEMESFGSFLETVKINFLMAVAASHSMEKVDPVILRSTLSKANETIDQINYRNISVINMISVLESYILDKSKDGNTRLEKAHDILAYNEIGNSLVLQDKVMIKYFEKKRLFGSESQADVDNNLKGTVNRDIEALNRVSDMEKLGIIIILETERLGYLIGDVEKLGFNNVDKLMSLDAEKLGARYTDMEQLGSFLNSMEKLGLVNSNEQLRAN